MCNQQIKDDCNKSGSRNDSWLFPRYITEEGCKLYHTVWFILAQRTVVQF